MRELGIMRRSILANVVFPPQVGPASAIIIIRMVENRGKQTEEKRARRGALIAETKLCWFTSRTLYVVS